MAHLSDVAVMKVPNTVLKHKHATRNTLARNRMLARLTETSKQGALLATHDNTELMWLRRHVGTDDIAEPEPYLFCFQHDWDALTPAERALRTIKGLAEFHPDWAFWGYDAALLWGLEVPNDLLGPRFLVKTGCSVTLSGGCRLLRPQMAGALERVDGVRVTSFLAHGGGLLTACAVLLRVGDCRFCTAGERRITLGFVRAPPCRLRGQARVSQGTGDCVVCGRAVRKRRQVSVPSVLYCVRLSSSGAAGGVSRPARFEPGVSRRLFLAARERDVCHRRARREGKVYPAGWWGSGVGRPIRGRTSTGVPSDNARAQGASVYV